MSARTLIALTCTAILALGAPGCGIILGYGALQPVAVTTNIEGAKLTYNGTPHENEVTPCTLMLHPSKEYQIIASNEEGARGTGFIKKQIRIPVAVMDGVFTLGIGLLIDYLSGSLYSLQPTLHVNLGTQPAPAPTPSPVGPGPTSGDAPCAICGEPRGNETPCPHCGME